MVMTRNFTSPQELFDLMNESDLIRNLNHHYYQGEYAGSAKVQEELLAWINSNNIMLNGQKITLNNLEIHEGGNNFNIIIKADNIGLVLQFGLRPPAVDESIQFLTSTGERPNWLAHQYDQKNFGGTSQYIILNSPREKDKHPDNPFDTQNLGLLSVQEFCPDTLKNKVTALHKTQGKTDYAQVVKLTADVGKSMSELLSDISGNDVLWTDIKPGNLLFHANGTLAIADTKAFMPIEKMPYRRIKGDKNIFNYSGLVTEGFLSDYMRRNVLGAELTRNQLQAVWEKEYSYQLGVLLYYVATGSEYISPRFNLDPYIALDFNKPVFVSEAGQRLQYVIERLIDHNPVQNLTDDNYYFQTDPNNRLHTAQAHELLARIDNKELFDKKVQEIAEQNKQFKANTVHRNQGKHDEIKLPQELLNIKNIVENIKPKYEGRLLGLKYKLSKKNTTSMTEKYAVIEAINQKAEQLIAQYPVKSVAQIQSEMQSYLRRELLVLENQNHVKSALRKFIDSALQEIKQQQLTKAPVPKSVPKEIIPLKLDEYIKLYFNKTSQTVRNRPFDTSHYKDPQSKKAGEYGANAKAWKITDIKPDVLNLESVNALRAIMQVILKDIQPHLPVATSNTDKKSLEFLQAGYLFNAFNQKMLAELKSHATESRKLELKQLAEFVRLIADDLVMGKTPEESLQRLQERNMNKVQALAQRALCNEILRGEGGKSIQQEEANVLKLAGIDKDSFLSNIRAYASIGENEINKKINPKDAVNSLHREQMQILKEILVEAFARTALEMDKDIANKAKYPIVGMFAGMKEMEINHHALKIDFEDLLMVSEGVLSITKFFANNIGVRMLNSQEKQHQILKINNHLANLIANYPIHPKTGDRVTANDIRREMRDELMNIVQTPELKGLLEKHINRVVGRQSTILENGIKSKEEVVVKENQQKNLNEPPEQSRIHRRML